MQSGIVDAHVHFVDPSRPGGVVWPSRDSPFFGRRMYGEYAADMMRLGVDDLVLVETSRRPGDDIFLRDEANAKREVIGYVANLQPDEPSFEQRLTSHCAQPKFKAVRLRPIDAFPLDDQATVGICNQLSCAGAHVEIGVKTPDRLEPLFTLCDAAPSTRFVLVHAGHPIVDNGEISKSWRSLLSDRCAPENLWCKITPNYGAHLPHENRVGREKHSQILSFVSNAFSTKRIMFGSNWPVATLDEAAELMRAIEASFGQDDVTRICRENARNVYAA